MIRTRQGEGTKFIWEMKWSLYYYPNIPASNIARSLTAFGISTTCTWCDVNNQHQIGICNKALNLRSTTWSMTLVPASTKSTQLERTYNTRLLQLVQRMLHLSNAWCNPRNFDPLFQSQLPKEQISVTDFSRTAAQRCPRAAEYGTSTSTNIVR